LAVYADLDEIMLGGERRSQVEVRQAGAVSRWLLVMTSRRETRLRPCEEHVQSVSGNEKSQRRILFLVSSVQSSRNGDMPLNITKLLFRCFKNALKGQPQKIFESLLMVLLSSFYS
jgi:hypothetical protein